MKTKDAIAYYGSHQKLADALGIKRQAIGIWGENVPDIRQFELERLTEGALRVSDPVRLRYRGWLETPSRASGEA